VVVAAAEAAEEWKNLLYFLGRRANTATTLRPQSGKGCRTVLRLPALLSTISR
jgi:hypothetical protein